MQKEKNEEIKKFLKNAGRRGGERTLNKHGKKHFSEIGKKGLEARWGKTRKKI